MNKKTVIETLTIKTIYDLSFDIYGKRANKYRKDLRCVKYGNVTFTNGLTLLYYYDTKYDNNYYVGDKVRIKYEINETRFKDGNILFVQEPCELFGSETLNYEAPQMVKDFFDELYFKKHCLMKGKYKDKYKDEDFLENCIKGALGFVGNADTFIWLFNNGKLSEKYTQDYIVGLSYTHGVNTNGYDGVNKNECYKNISKFSNIDYDLFSKMWDEIIINDSYFCKGNNKDSYFPCHFNN